MSPIGDVAADKKKGATLTLADAKKQARNELPKLQQVDDIVATVLGLEQKLYKELGTPTLGGSTNLDLSVMVGKYCPAFIKYYATFEIALNKIR